MKGHLLNIKIAFLFWKCGQKWLIRWPILLNVWGDICTLLRQYFHHKIALHERQFSWHLRIFLRQHMVQNEACRLLFALAQFYQNVDSPFASTTTMLERAHAWPHPRWANVFAKLIKTLVTGMTKNVLLSEFRWLNLTADSTAKSQCLGKSGGR